MYREFFLLHLHFMYSLPSHSWYIVRGDYKWAISTTMKSLSSLTSLTSFQLYCGFHQGFVLPLHILSGLRRITVIGECRDFRTTVVLPLARTIANSPELSYLDVYYAKTWSDCAIPSLRDLFCNKVSERGSPLRHLSLMSWDASLDNVSLAHFRSLNSFTFRTYRDDRQTKDSRPLWKALLAGGIRLEALSADDISSELVDFIVSFSGLRSLTLVDLGIQSQETSDDIADMFFRHALPTHRSTLRSLTLDTAYQGKWCFSEVNAATILDCQRLRDLSIALRWEDYDAENSQRSPVVCQLFHVSLCHITYSMLPSIYSSIMPSSLQNSTTSVSLRHIPTPPAVAHATQILKMHAI
jgi:hypothetical protein